MDFVWDGTFLLNSFRSAHMNITCVCMLFSIFSVVIRRACIRRGPNRAFSNLFLQFPRSFFRRWNWSMEIGRKIFLRATFLRGGIIHPGSPRSQIRIGICAKCIYFKMNKYIYKIIYKIIYICLQNHLVDSSSCCFWARFNSSVEHDIHPLSFFLCSLFSQ